MRSGKKMKEILAILAGGTLATLEILDELWPTGFTRSYAHNRSALFKKSKADIDIAELQRFYNLLNYLKREGFIEKEQAYDNIFWKITSNGLNKLGLIKEKTINYQIHSDGKLKIVVFDVPEKERRKRAWLREALKMLGFKMLQQSVWMGKNKIPEQFLVDLRKKNLLPCIHIMEVSRGGAIRELT